MLRAYAGVLFFLVISKSILASSLHELCSSSSDMSISSLGSSPTTSPFSSCTSLPGSPIQARVAITPPLRSKKVECCLGVLLPESVCRAQDAIAQQLSQDSVCGYKFMKVIPKHIRLAWLGSMSVCQESAMRIHFNELQKEYAGHVCGAVNDRFFFTQEHCMQQFTYHPSFVQFVTALIAAAAMDDVKHLSWQSNNTTEMYLGYMQRTSQMGKLTDAQSKLIGLSLGVPEFKIDDLCLYFEQDYDASDR